MHAIFLWIILTIVLLFSASLRALETAILSSSKFEVRRNAQLRKKGAHALYTLQSRGYEVILSIVILQVLFAVIAVLVLRQLFSPLATVVIAIVAIVFVTELWGRFYAWRFVQKSLDFVWPVFIKLLNVLKPFTVYPGRFLDKRFGNKLPTIYSREQLHKLLADHVASADSEIEASQLEIVKHALDFGSKLIREVMTPKRMMQMVNADTQINPIIMDELHKSGHSRFPVFHGDDNTIVGILYLRKLAVSSTNNHKVKDVMEKEVYFVNEELPLGHALQAFIRTKHHLFIVVNRFEEVVGLISLEDVIEQIIGKQVVDEFDTYENLREVAQLHAEKQREQTEHKVVK